MIHDFLAQIVGFGGAVKARFGKAGRQCHLVRQARDIVRDDCAQDRGIDALALRHLDGELRA